MRPVPSPSIQSIEHHQLQCEKRSMAGRGAVRSNIEFHVAIARASHNNVVVVPCDTRPR